MNISMTGIDFNTASLDVRERFALTKAAQEKLLLSIRRYAGVEGCVIINTCNRMELWLSSSSLEKPAFDILCELFGADAQENNTYFTHRDGSEAVRHLFELAGGLKSLIFGEEQILSQVKESLAFARERKASDPVLEALFRHAVTAAKKAKSTVRLMAVDQSAAKSAVQVLKSRYDSLNGLKCLVIGSGEMGRLSARELVSEGCDVTMTLRQYHSGEAVIPAGCSVIDYEERHSLLPTAQVIFSATRSPHYTLQYEHVYDLVTGQEKLLFDLAVPRDIDPKIAQIPGITLLDIDRLGGNLAAVEDNQSVLRVKEIIGEEIKEFERWCSIRALMPQIAEIGAYASADVEERIDHSLRNVPLDENSRQLVREAASKAVGKVVESVLLRFQKNSGGLDASCLKELIQDIPHADTEETSEGSPPRFPLFVDLTGKKISVIGAGPIALRRIRALCAYPCSIVVTAPEAVEEIVRLHQDNKIIYNKKAYEPADIEDAFLVIAATDDRTLNHRIAQDAGRHGRHCSVADCKEECSFYFPATVHYEDGVIGICGTGDNHSRTKDIASEIREFMKTREQL